jgi:hypothetical protein
MVPNVRERKPERKGKNLIRLGIDHEAPIHSGSRTSMGCWAVEQRPIPFTTITLERLRKRGYKSMIKHYTKIAHHILMNRCVRIPLVQLCSRFSQSAIAFGAAHSIKYRCYVVISLVQVYMN